MLASKLGWILTGRITEPADDTIEQNMLILTYSTNAIKKTGLPTQDKSFPIKPNIEDFWNLEAIGITDSPKDSDKARALQLFNETLKFENISYRVSWPWKEDKSCLPENKKLAFGRLKSLINRMKHTPELIDKYDEIIQHQLKLGVIEKVASSRQDTTKHYIPHHAVINPDKSSTKVRVVYDASPRIRKEQKSLNECLYPGPTMLKDLLRFRLNRIAIVADIEKAFFQDRTLRRCQGCYKIFLATKQKAPVTREQCQGLHIQQGSFWYHIKSLSTRGYLDHHLKGYGNRVAETTRDNIYVDNVVTGADTATEAVSFYADAKQIFKDVSMNLRDWVSNDESFMNEIPENDRASPGSMKILGLTWIMETDMICLKGRSHKLSGWTKRMVLKQLASVYDQLGLFSPVTLLGKIFLQTMWNKNIPCDKPLQEHDEL